MKFTPNPKAHITDNDDEHDVEYLAHYYVKCGDTVLLSDLPEVEAFKTGFEIGYLRAMRELKK